MRLYASGRFLNSYYKGSLCLQGEAVGAVNDFIRRVESNPTTVARGYDVLRHLLGKARILELKIGGGNRLLAHWAAEELTMLEVGGHEIVPRYTLREFRHDMSDRAEAPGEFQPGGSSFFVRYPDGRPVIKYGEETTAEWVYFLEPGQREAFDEIFESIFDARESGSFCPPTLIIGGPGTGKTCVLLNLLKYLFDMGFDVGLEISDSLASYVEKSADANIAQFRVGPEGCAGKDVVLIDDPSTDRLRSVLNQTRVASGPCFVLAFDPLQLDQPLSDAEFDRLRSANGAAVYMLSGCYRQKEKVGKATKHVMDVVAASTPYLDEGKKSLHRDKYRRLTETSNNLKFLNPLGHVEFYEDPNVEHIRKEVNRILKADWMMWRHWPGLLIILHNVELTPETLEVLRPLLQRRYIMTVNAADIETVKGLEFQHVFIFMDLKLFTEIQNGFEGTGRRVYNQRRLLRIPFSRAKDSLVTFVI